MPVIRTCRGGDMEVLYHGVAPAAGAVSFGSMPDRPNVLWIFTDQQRRDTYNSSIMFADPEPRANLTMVRTGRHKLVVAHGRGEGEMYDLQEDPEEACNRFFDPAYTDVKVDMLCRLTDRMAFTADPLPEPARAGKAGAGRVA